MGKLLGEMEAAAGIPEYRQQKAQEVNLPGLMPTLQDKKMSSQFYGYLNTLKNEEIDYMGGKIKIDGEAIIKTLADYNIKYARGERPTDPPLTPEQRFVLGEKHKQFQEMRQNNEKAKTTLQSQEIFHALMASPEIGPLLKGIDTKEQVIELLDLYFQKAFESGDKTQLEQMKKIVEGIDKYGKNFETGTRLDGEIEKLFKLYPNEFTEKEMEDIKSGNTEDMAKLLIERKGRKWKDVGFIRNSSRLLSYCTNSEFRTNIDQRQKLLEDIQNQFKTEIADATIPEQVIKIKNDFDISRGALKTAFETALKLDPAHPEKSEIFSRVYTEYISGIKPEDIAKPEGPSMSEIAKTSREMVEQGIVPDDETFDNDKFKAYFGENAPDFNASGAEGKFAEILKKKGIETSSILGKAYLEILFGEMKDKQGKFEKSLVGSEKKELVDIKRQSEKTKEILTKLRLKTSDFEAGKRFELAKTNDERKEIIVENIKLAQEKIDEKIRKSLAEAFGIDSNALLLNMLREKVFSINKPNKTLAKDSISEHLIYTENLANKKFDWGDQKTVLGELKTKADKLNTLEKDNNKLDDSKLEKGKINGAIVALDKLRKVIVKRNKFDAEEKAFDVIIDDPSFPPDAKTKFDEFRKEFIKAKENMLRINNEKMQAPKKTPANVLPAGAI